MIYMIIIVAVIVIFIGVASEKASGKDSTVSSFKPSQRNDTPTVLREQMSGYDKASLISKLDQYNSLIVLLEDHNISYEDAVKEYDIIKSEPIKRAPGHTKGFNIEDSDEYIRGCAEKIDQLMIGYRG